MIKQLQNALQELGINPVSQIEFEENATKTVVVGMSGGVDSAVAALLVKAQGYKVIGIFMKNWDDQSGACTSEEDYKDVARVADQLEVPYYTFNFAQDYKERVFKSFLIGYEQGITPNPDILCNSEIKFDTFYKQAKLLGADYLATGHYCQIFKNHNHFYLKKAIDLNKDQSYFLHYINPLLFKDLMFPLGNLTKPLVRKIASTFQLANANKRDSTGICFIGKTKFSEFILQYIKEKEGYFVDFDTKEIVGKHLGQHLYTLGQRKGLGLGGAGEPWYVVAKDKTSANVFVARGEEHSALYADELYLEEIHWLIDIPEVPFKCHAKIRYRQADQACELFYENTLFKVVFAKPQRAITPGQSIVFYQDDICLGGGFIVKTGQSYYDQGKNIKDFK